MNEALKRAISGLIYVAVMWIGTSNSQLSFRLLFTILGVISIYEMWKLRKGKSKFLAFSYVLIPFILIQFILINEMQKNWNSNLILSDKDDLFPKMRVTNLNTRLLRAFCLWCATREVSALTGLTMRRGDGVPSPKTEKVTSHHRLSIRMSP